MGQFLNEIQLSVGELTELSRVGDINFRFSARSSASEGVAAHRAVQSSRGTGYVSEHPVAHEIVSDDIKITVAGRVDGCFIEDEILIVDEIKSVRVRPEEIPADVMDGFWRQAIYYGYMLARELLHDRVTIRVCLYHLDEKKEYQFSRSLELCELAQHFADGLLLFIGQVEKRRQWKSARDACNGGLAFPYGEYRPGQRDMAVSVYRALTSGEQLVMQAPTGIGKTMGTLFPAVHALSTTQGVERLFYLSAKTSTQKLVENSAADLATAGARMRTVTLTAKDKICFSRGQPCDPEHCQYADGYYDKVHGAIDEMLESGDLFDRQGVEEAARNFQLCPFELGLDLSRFCDLVICDYNYVFDPVVYLRRFFDDQRLDSLVLVDEAHNLVDRGRDMFSAEIEKSEFLDLAKALRESGNRLHRQASAVNRAFLDLKKRDDRFDETGHLTSPEPPEKLLGVLHQFCSDTEEELRNEGSEAWRDNLLEVYFSALRFVRTAEEFNEDYVTLLSQGGRKRQMRLKLYCVDPSNRLNEGFERLAGSVCFSATMQPQDYFRRMLGIRQGSSWYQLPSPFPASNLNVCIAGFIETTFGNREGSVAPIVSLVHEMVSSRAGNYLVFFPSYVYMELVSAAFAEAHPGIDIEVQQRNMSDEGREAYLARFEGGPVCGFAVMGGVFSEGIDLTGDRLIGALVVGVGLPQLGIDRDLIRDHFDESGFEYAYQYPGLVRVLQTAGRVIRSDDDRGVVCLVDRRYLQARYRDLLPSHWITKAVNSVSELGDNLRSFWQS